MLKVDGERLLRDLENLARLGATPDGGVCRPAFSSADVEGRRWFRRQVQAAGLEFREDGAGNLSAVLPCDDPSAPTLLAGSHLDTVPDGGRFDGSLGVLAALEALRTLKEREVALPVHLEAISFTDEEGTLLGEIGSRALAGTLTAEALESARGGTVALEEGMTRLGITLETVQSAARLAKSLAGYVELHIEQGTRLEEAGLQIGAVTGIVGIRSGRLHFQGVAGHGGTLPMDRRKDALWGAAEFLGRARRRIVEDFSPGVMNCGALHVRPSAFNVVPGQATLSLEMRHGSEEILDVMEEALLRLAREAASDLGVEVIYEPAERCPAAPSSERVVRIIEDAAEALGLAHTRLLSFAGHDAQVLAPITPTAMIFVPCVDGISHNPRELCTSEDIVNGANVLLHTLLCLAAPVVA